MPGDEARRRRRRAAGSIIVVVATDAPLLPHQCERLAQRAGLGIARVGGTGGHTSGDLFIAFATGNRLPLGDGLDEARSARGPTTSGSPATSSSTRSSTPSSNRPRRRSSTRSSPPRRWSGATASPRIACRTTASARSSPPTARSPRDDRTAAAPGRSTIRPAVDADVETLDAITSPPRRSATAPVAPRRDARRVPPPPRRARPVAVAIDAATATIDRVRGRPSTPAGHAISPTCSCGPTGRAAAIGGRLLDAVFGDAWPRTTFASDDPRALPLYVRAGMAAFWPNLYLDRRSGTRSSPSRTTTSEPATLEAVADLQAARGPASIARRTSGIGDAPRRPAVPRPACRSTGRRRAWVATRSARPSAACTRRSPRPERRRPGRAPGGARRTRWSATIEAARACPVRRPSSDDCWTRATGSVDRDTFLAAPIRPRRPAPRARRTPGSSTWHGSQERRRPGQPGASCGRPGSSAVGHSTPTATGFSIGTPIRLPYSVHDPS